MFLVFLHNEVIEKNLITLLAAAAAAAKSLQSCLTLCDPIDGSPPGSPIPGILQARILERVAISFSRGSSRPRDQTQVSRICRQKLYCLSHQGLSLGPHKNVWFPFLKAITKCNLSHQRQLLQTVALPPMLKQYLRLMLT